MSRLSLGIASLLVLWGVTPSVSIAAYQKAHAAAGPKAHAAARPIKAGASHWKANVGSLKTYARAAQPKAVRVVAARAVQYPPSNVTIEGLLAKRALNPAKFDRTYPNIGRLLARDERLRAANNSGPLNGLLYPSAYHNYLQWRRGLDPVRFDYYHPVLGTILAEDQRIRDLVATNNPSTPTNPSAGELTPPDTTPTVPGIPAGGDEGGGPPPGIPAGGSDGGGPPGTGITPPGIITITAVPEPRSIVLVLLGAIVLVGRSARRAGQRRGAIAAAD